MRFAGIKGCKPNEVIKYKYVHDLNEKEAADFKAFVGELFGLNEVNKFGLSTGGYLIVNGGQTVIRDKDLDREKVSALDTYIKEKFDGRWLGITDAFFDGEKLLCYSVCRNEPREMPLVATEEQRPSFFDKLKSFIGV